MNSDVWSVTPATTAAPAHAEEAGVTAVASPASVEGGVTKRGPAMLALDRRGALLWIEPSNLDDDLRGLALTEPDGRTLAETWRRLFWSKVRPEPTDQFHLFHLGVGSWVATTYWQVAEPGTLTVSLLRTARGPEIDPLWARILGRVRAGDASTLRDAA